MPCDNQCNGAKPPLLSLCLEGPAAPLFAVLPAEELQRLRDAAANPAQRKALLEEVHGLRRQLEEANRANDGNQESYLFLRDLRSSLCERVDALFPDDWRDGDDRKKQLFRLLAELADRRNGETARLKELKARFPDAFHDGVDCEDAIAGLLEELQEHRAGDQMLRDYFLQKHAIVLDCPPSVPEVQDAVDSLTNC